MSLNCRAILLAQIGRHFAVSPLSKRLAWGGFWSLLGAVVSRGLTLLMTLVLVRLLGRQGYGEFGMLQNTVALLATFAGMGLGQTTQKYVAEFRQKNPQLAGRIIELVIMSAIVCGLIAYGGCFALSTLLSEQVLQRADFAPMLRVFGLVLLVMTLDGVLTSTLAGFEAFRSIAVISGFSALGGLGVAVPLVYFYGLWGAVIAQLGIGVLSLSASTIAIFDECRRQGVPLWIGGASRAEWAILYRYALPALAASTLVAPVLWLGNIVLIRTPDGYAELGGVNVVNTLRLLVGYLPTMLLAPAFAIMANSIDSPEKLAKTMRYCFNVSAMCVLPLGIVLTLMGSEILGILYGPQYMDESPKLAWGMLVVGIQATGACQGQYLLATGRLWLGLGVNLVWAILFLGLALILIPFYHGTGLMAALGISYASLTIIFYSMFMLRWPQLLAGYPLLPTLLLYGALVAVAFVLQLHTGWVTRVYLAPFLGGGMMGTLVQTWRNHRGWDEK